MKTSLQSTLSKVYEIGYDVYASIDLIYFAANGNKSLHIFRIVRLLMLFLSEKFFMDMLCPIPNEDKYNAADARPIGFFSNMFFVWI